MTKPRKTLVLLVSLACALAAPLAFSTPAAAAEVVITLFGSSTDGWGRDSTTLSIPGPNLEARVGDNVTMVLNGTDGRNHNWFIDYDDDSTPDANEPGSGKGNFRDVEVRWNFTADRNGTFVYRSSVATDEDTMYGNITILPASGGQIIPGIDNSVLIIVGVVVAVIAVAAVAMKYVRRSKGPESPPPPEE